MSLNTASLKISTSKFLEILLGVSLLAICSQITIPLNPVPITLQTVGVLFIALTYNRINAMASIITYTVLGFMGAPVFINYSFGISKLTGVTGGYIIGFIAAVYTITTLKNKLSNNKILDNILLCLIGSVIIYTFGYLWLAGFIGFSKAFVSGVLPFIIPGIIKSFLLVGLIRVVKL
ncbi:MAG: biotin transporter BioY [Rickettsia endosymbiont of Bryobia graminum]|nr:biotin transporter BioY [Rickettsia endosymbiont of Bryobia graminum]